MALLGRRIVAYDGANNSSDRNPLPSDTAMVRTVVDNFGSAAASHNTAPAYTTDPIRSTIATGGWLAIPAAAGTVVNQWEGDIENSNVLEVLQRIAEYSFSQNEPLFFDVIQTGPYGQFQFQTYLNQRGTDRTTATGGANAITISPENNTIGEYELRFSCKDYINRVYAAGQGSGNTRPYETVDKATLAADLVTDPFALREEFLSVNSDNATDIRKDGEAELAAKALAVQLSGTLTDTSAFQFGRDYNFGDRFTAFVEGTTVEVFIDTMDISIEDGKETLKPGFSTDLVKRQTGIGRIFQQLSQQRKLIRSILTRE
jgi:hypothetical protein